MENNNIKNKIYFLSFVRHVITEHPEWMADLQMAVQNGISDALSMERAEKSNLAYLSVSIAQKSPRAVDKEKYSQGINSMYNFFKNAPIGAWINKTFMDKKGE